VPLGSRALLLISSYDINQDKNIMILTNNFYFFVFLQSVMSLACFCRTCIFSLPLCVCVLPNSARVFQQTIFITMALKHKEVNWIYTFCRSTPGTWQTAKKQKSRSCWLKSWCSCPDWYRKTRSKEGHENLRALSPWRNNAMFVLIVFAVTNHVQILCWLFNYLSLSTI
jgi:hypothetical protein